MKNVAVDADGIPFIHYLADKTKRIDHVEKTTPILRYALDLIKKWNFTFPILKNVNGKSGYNVKIKALLKHCELNRVVTYFNEEEGENETKSLHEAGSSKLCRKTFVDMINKAQINMYAAGLTKKVVPQWNDTLILDSKNALFCIVQHSISQHIRLIKTRTSYRKINILNEEAVPRQKILLDSWKIK